MDKLVTRKRFVGMVAAGVASLGLYAVGVQEQKKSVNMDIKIVARGKV